jgi:hypothetical protein
MDEEEEPQPPEPDGQVGDFKAIVTRLKGRQQQLYANADAAFMEAQPDKDDELREKMNREFQDFGLKSEADEELLLEILEAICIRASPQFANEQEKDGQL